MQALVGFSTAGDVGCFLILKFDLAVQLSDELIFEHVKLVLVCFQSLPEHCEGREGLRDELVATGVWDLHEKRDRHDVKRVLLVQVAETLHHHQQVVLFGQ